MNEPRKIEEVTADAIKRSVLQVAEDMRAYAKQAQDKAAELVSETAELSQAVIADVSGLADRVAGLLDNCRAAAGAMREHRKLLSALPEAVERPPDRADEVGHEAVADKLSALAGQLGTEFPAPESVKVPKALRRSDAMVQK
jgi:hypothetical protein